MNWTSFATIRPLFACLVLSAAPAALAQGKKIADVEVSIKDAALTKKDAGIRTMFLVVYDADSKMPMPYGAMKINLDKDAKGTFYKGTLTSDNVQAMSGGELPKNIRIKARLDKDGSAGRDETGDLVGIVEKVALGASAKITIDKAI